MLLADKDLRKLVLNNQVISGHENGELNRNINPASIDLTIGNIFAHNADVLEVRNSDDMAKLQGESKVLHPGEMVIIKVSEHFNMPKKHGGIIFTPNSLSKRGLLMTNPGHIDPGFEGHITVCLVNMGKQQQELKKDDTIATLLVFQLSSDSEGYQTGTATGISTAQLNSIGKDFASLDKRLPSLISSYINKRLGIFITSIGVILAAYALLIPELGQYRLSKIKENEITTRLINPISQQLNTLDLKSKDDRAELDRRLGDLETKQNHKLEELLSKNENLRRELLSLKELVSEHRNLSGQLPRKKDNLNSSD